MKTKVLFLDRFPLPKTLAESPILIFDLRLLENKKTKKWIESFPNSIGVQAGENLKQIKQFEKYFVEILHLIERTKIRNITLIGLGGGSIGDFVGFMASVFKRGVPLVHIPSTWLAAIDSAHGGKTALNIAGYKNQVGTYYSAERVYLVKELIKSQPNERVTECMGEVLKTVLLRGGPLWKKTQNLSSMNSEVLWRLLPDLILYKNKIVKIDPYEKKGPRLFLNFGHTFGHVLEAIQGWPHGVAVNYGLRLAIELSFEQGVLGAAEYTKINQSEFIKKFMMSRDQAFELLQKTPGLERFLLQDKKALGKNSTQFVLLKKIGVPFVKSLSLNELIAFAKKK